jgi:hypothetical protein
VSWEADKTGEAVTPEARLRELAQAALDESSSWFNCAEIADFLDRYDLSIHPVTDGRLIEACDPLTILALLDKIALLQRATEEVVAAACVATREACVSFVRDCACPDCAGKGYVHADNTGDDRIIGCDQCDSFGTLHPFSDIIAKLATLDLSTLAPRAAAVARVVAAAKAWRKDAWTGDAAALTIELKAAVDVLEGPAKGEA